MADETIPEPTEPEAPEAPEAPAAPAVAEARRARPLWPFVVGGGVILALVLTGIVIGVVSLLGAFGSDPKKAVTDYDLSFENADCDLFTGSTTQQFQDDFFGGTFDCEAFVTNADGLTVDGEYTYDVSVVISSVDGDTAEVVTNEVDTSAGDPVEFTLRYHLVKDGSRWLIDGIDNETPGTD